MADSGPSEFAGFADLMNMGAPENWQNAWQGLPLALGTPGPQMDGAERPAPVQGILDHIAGFAPRPKPVEDPQIRGMEDLVARLQAMNQRPEPQFSPRTPPQQPWSPPRPGAYDTGDQGPMSEETIDAMIRGQHERSVTGYRTQGGAPATHLASQPWAPNMAIPPVQQAAPQGPSGPSPERLAYAQQRQRARAAQPSMYVDAQGPMNGITGMGVGGGIPVPQAGYTPDPRNTVEVGSNIQGSNSRGIPNVKAHQAYLDRMEAADAGPAARVQQRGIDRGYQQEIDRGNAGGIGLRNQQEMQDQMMDLLRGGNGGANNPLVGGMMFGPQGYGAAMQAQAAHDRFGAEDLRFKAQMQAAQTERLSRKAEGVMAVILERGGTMEQAQEAYDSVMGGAAGVGDTLWMRGGTDAGGPDANPAAPLETPLVPPAGAGVGAPPVPSGRQGGSFGQQEKAKAFSTFYERFKTENQFDQSAIPYYHGGEEAFASSAVAEGITDDPEEAKAWYRSRFPGQEPFGQGTPGWMGPLGWTMLNHGY